MGARVRSFPPLARADARVLILGSMPGAESLRRRQYYAHPRNQFWRLLADLLGEPLIDLPYQQRLQVVCRHRLGIWDVYGACDRQGSADSAIRGAQANRFARLKRRAPNLIDIAFNGRTAGQFAPALAAGGFRTTILPSSSPANASFSYRQKLAAWRAWWLAWPPVADPGPAVR